PPERRKWDDLETLLNDAPPELRNTTDWRLIQADLMIAQGKTDAARTPLEAARTAEPKQPAYWLALAGPAPRQGQPATPRRILADAEKELGDRVNIRLARGRLATGPDAAQVLAGLADRADKFSQADQIELLAGLYRLATGVDAKLARKLGDRFVVLAP